MTLTRSPFLRQPVREARPPKGPKPKKCTSCRCEFLPRSPMARACSVECAVKIATATREAVERKADRARKAKLKTKGDHIADAQVAFNAYIRMRDQLAGYPCISSGLPLDWSGNNVDAGHYRSRGSAPHLRFDERNVHAQSKQENRYASGNATDYRIGLIKRIGLAAVEALEADQEPRRYTVEELIAIKVLYRLKLKQLKEASHGS